MISKRFCIKMVVSAALLIMTVWMSAYAALKSVDWNVNPSDFRYDMSLYFALADRSLEDLDKYEIGAFVDDECRGVAEKIKLTGDESCLYMRIRSNEAKGSQVEFRMREKGSEVYTLLKPEDGADFLFEADTRVGMPSSPFILARYFNVEVSAGDNGSVDFTNGLYKEGDELTLKAIPDSGYRFTQWSDGNQDATRTLTVDGNVSLTAFFEAGYYSIVFRIGDEVISSDNLPFGQDITAPEAPAKEGYTFSGWTEYPETMPDHDVEVTGEYTINTYTVTYQIDNEVVGTQTYEYGAPIVVMEVPEKEGHTFSGWGDVPETMPAFDIVLGGTYADNFYTITFRLDGVVIFTDDLPYESPITVPDVPEKEGYTFSGWGEVPAIMPAYNLDIDGSYTINYYSLAFIVDGEVVWSGQMPYGAEIVVPDAPVKDGYSFSSWGVVPSTMPASDLEIVGSYTLNYYTLTYRIGEEDFFTTQVPYGSEITAPEVPGKDGYTFTGWTGLPETMPANDLVVSGAYTLNNYVLTFRIGEDIIFTGEIPYGSEISAPEAPSKEGYTFTGWSNLPATMPASDLEVVGAYEVNIYNITYRIDDEDFYTTQLPYGSDVIAPEPPAKEGYTFTGWSDVVTTMPANDLVISGTYSLNSYNISFKIGEEVIFAGSIPYGSEISVPEAPAKEGYTFTGWGEVPSTMPASDLEFEGSYDVNFYTLTFDIDGEVFFTTQLAYGTAITAPTNVPDKEGNTFGGWGDVPAVMPANDLVISGTYSVNHYTVTFRIGEEVLFTGEQPYGSEIVVPEAPEKEGHTFLGWGEVPAVVPAMNLEFVGEYKVNQYSLVFTVDGEEISSELVDYGSPILTPEVAPKTGYTFSGWGVVPATMPASDLQIAGTYEINYYNVTFKVGEDIVFTAQLPYEGTIEVPEAPAKEGFTFSGWGEVPTVMPAEDLVFEGEYVVNLYTLTFRIGDEVIYSEMVAYGDTVVAPEAPEKEGHTFLGWGVVPATMPAADLEITGAYDVNQYSVVFKIGDEVIASSVLAYGSEIVVPEAPEKEGHEFLGWGEVPATMPASDLEFNGTYKLKTYKLVFKIGDEVISESMVEYGAIVIAPEAPEKEGYTFAGWGIVPTTMPASDIEINGEYAVNYYRLVVYLNDEIYIDNLLPYGAEIVVPDPVVDDNMEFKGWNEEIPSVMPAHDVEIHGTVEGEPTSAVKAALESDNVIVYSVDGVMLYKGVKNNSIFDRLTPGVYIVNGKKTIIR